MGEVYLSIEPLSVACYKSYAANCTLPDQCTEEVYHLLLSLLSMHCLRTCAWAR